MLGFEHGVGHCFPASGLTQFSQETCVCPINSAPAVTFQPGFQWKLFVHCRLESRLDHHRLDRLPSIFSFGDFAKEFFGKGAVACLQRFISLTNQLHSLELHGEICRSWRAEHALNFQDQALVGYFGPLATQKSTRCAHDWNEIHMDDRTEGAFAEAPAMSFVIIILLFVM
jgi:hypothetical protein